MEDGMIVPVLGVLLPIIISLGAFVMVVYLRKFQNMERMMIIEKGLAPDMFKKERFTNATIRWSLLLIGVGIGFLIGYWLDRSFDMEQVGYFSMLFIFGGLGLGVAYFIEERENRRKG
ncbi:MAG TPA: hypothetical protein PLX35_13855 [Cyclobacteriaceae bacterium]|nr:hypothetical protein [Cyclobacteriaceae bacterium]